MNNFIKIFLGALLGIFSLFCQISYAASDIVAQNYAAARSANIQSCTAGYDLVSGDITYQKAHILGALPYHLNYRAPLRQNLSAAQTFAQPESTSLGWVDNYQAHVFVQNMSSQTIQYQNYTAQVSGQNYILSTSNPVITASFSVKEIFVRLPGETVDTIFKEENGKFTRLYSADAVRDLNNYGLRQLSWSSDLGEYQMSRSGNNLIIVKNGIQYTVSDVSYNISPAQTHTEAINLYVDKSGYLRTTTDSWYLHVFLMPSYANSNTAPYIETKTTVSMNLHRITQINQQGRNLNLEYDHLLNLTQVTDNFNNKLVFERTFHDPGLGANQTVDESRLVTKVSYSSGSQGDSQTVEFDYQAYTNKVPSTGANTVVFALVRSNSTAGGAYSYVNEMTELGSIKAYVKSKGRTADESYDYPVLTKVLNHRGVIERAWEINQNYILNAQNGYSTAQTRLRSFIPNGSAAISDTTTTYDDVANIISMNFYPDGSQSATTTVSTEIIDNNNIKMTVTGFPCLFENKTPVSTLNVYTPRSQLLRVTDRNGNVTAREYDTLNRVTKLTEAVDSNLQRQTLYSYTTLSDGMINSTATPNAINAPEMNIVNLLNARGQIYRQEVGSPQSGSQTKVHLYHYYEDQNQPTYGLLHIYDAPRGDVDDRTLYEYDIYGNLSKKTVIVNASTSGAVERNTVYRDYNSAGLPKSIILPDDSSDTIVYDGRYNVVKTTHYAGSQTQINQNTYDDLGRLISTTNPDNQTIRYDYNDVHQLIKKTLPNNNIEVYWYYPNGESSVVGYHHANGALAMSEWQELDENGRIKSYRKGGNTNSHWVRMNYDNNGNLIRTQTAQGIVNQWHYDQLNRVISHTDGNGYTNQKSYDSADNNTIEVAANNHGSSRSFLDHRYLSAEQNADFGQKNYQYDFHQNISRYTHNERLCNYGVYDQIQRPSQFVCNHGNQSSNPDLQVNDSYEYDSSGFGHLDQVRSPWVNTQYSYDHLHRIVAKSQQNKTATKYTNRNSTLNNFYSYSAGGLLTSITYPSGNRVDYNYNADGSLNNIKLNQQSLIQDIQYTGIDQLQRFNWGRGGSYVVGYDDTGSIVNILNGNSNAVSFVASYRYDLDGRIVVQDADNVSTNYSYDHNNQLIQERTPYYTSHHSYDNNGNQTFLEVSSNNAGITANSQPSCAFNATAYAEYYADIKNAFGYNRDLLLDHWLKYGMAEGRSPCGAVMPQCKFEPQTYRSIWPDLVQAQVDGNVHYRNNGVYEGRGICSKATSSNYNNYLNIIASRGYPAAERQPSCAFNATAYADYYPDLKNAFGYNHQLLFAHWLENGMPEGRTPCGASMPQCRFDALTYRNLWSDLYQSQSEGVWHYRLYGANEGRGICPASHSVNYASMSFVYSANHLTGLSVNGATQALGNFATGELSLSGNVAYDYAGRRRSESYGTQQVYFDYNHKNERTLRVGGGLNYQYIYDEASHLLGEYDLNGNTMVEYIWFGDKPIAALYGHGQLVYLVTDHQNKPRRGIDASSNEIVWRWDPDAYGVTQPVGRVNIHLRFPGQLFDGQSGLYYNHNRYYNPLLGRYMEADPIGLEGGLNPYAYAGNNPVMNVDPSGLYSFDLTPAFNQQFNNFNIGINSSAIPFPTDLGLNDLGKAAIASFSRMAGLLNVLTLSGDTPQFNREPWYNFYHGTDINSARALVAGKPLSLEIATSQKFRASEKESGFYMATNMFDATYFADRHANPAMINIRMQESTLTTLFSSGAKLQSLGGGMRFQGKEIYLPPSTFPTFDTLRNSRLIHIRLMPTKEWDIPMK